MTGAAHSSEVAATPSPIRPATSDLPAGCFLIESPTVGEYLKNLWEELQFIFDMPAPLRLQKVDEYNELSAEYEWLDQRRANLHEAPRGFN